MAYYLAQLCAALVLSVSPHRIIMGGGIMQRVRSFFMRWTLPESHFS